LNRIVVDAFLEAGVPIVSVQPSALARCCDGQLESMDTFAIQEALRHDLVPLVYGDVAFDCRQGCTIVSTESLLAYLAVELRPERIVLVGEVDGVYDRDPLEDASARRVPTITPGSFAQLRAELGGSHGVDVTGGMATKVNEMISLVERGLTGRVHLISGSTEGALYRTLLGAEVEQGTVIQPD
jgi:isopentenyl phosphate kinase